MLKRQSGTCISHKTPDRTNSRDRKSLSKRAALASDSRVAIHEYPKSDRAFARPGGVHFDGPAADVANMRSLSFLVDRLGGWR
jgi:hypothetical protein